MKEYKQLRLYLVRNTEDIYREIKTLEPSELKGILNYLDDELQTAWDLYRDDSISEAQYNSHELKIREIQDLVCKVKNNVPTGFEVVEEPKVEEPKVRTINDAIKKALDTTDEEVYKTKEELSDIFFYLNLDQTTQAIFDKLESMHLEELNQYINNMRKTLEALKLLLATKQLADLEYESKAGSIEDLLEIAEDLIKLREDI